MIEKDSYTPALGNHRMTLAYDWAIALMTREKHWRSKLLEILLPQEEETILDIGSGTGSLACLIKQISPLCNVTALDPDPAVLKVAQTKTRRAGLEVEFINSLGESEHSMLCGRRFEKVTISLVLHQCSASAKDGILKNAFRLLKPRGKLLIADYGLQKNWLMSLLFNQIRLLDGYENTRSNKNGEIPTMMEAVGFEMVKELGVTHTPTGSISLYNAHKPAASRG